MHRFFIFNEQQDPTNFIEPTNDLKHQLTKVLRIRIGEEFVCIYENLELICILEQGRIKVTKVNEFKIEKKRKVTLIQGLPTNKKVSMILQKATELDVDEIVLWQAKRSTSKLSSLSEKEDRLNKIIIEACEQSRRNDIPKLSFLNSIEDLDFTNSNVITLYENEHNKTYDEAISDCFADEIKIIIGPEGGIESSELDFLIESGSIVSTLGSNILRTETAAIAAIAVLVNRIRK